MTIKIKQMTKGKGYITYDKTKSDKPIDYGDAFKNDAIGPLESRATLNEWSDYGSNWKYPPPIKGKKT